MNDESQNRDASWVESTGGRPGSSADGRRALLLEFDRYIDALADHMKKDPSLLDSAKLHLETRAAVESLGWRDPKGLEFGTSEYDSWRATMKFSKHDEMDVTLMVQARKDLEMDISAGLPAASDAVLPRFSQELAENIRRDGDDGESHIQSRVLTAILQKVATDHGIELKQEFVAGRS